MIEKKDAKLECPECGNTDNNTIITHPSERSMDTECVCQLCGCDFTVKELIVERM